MSHSIESQETTAQLILLYLKALLSHWWELMSCAAFTFLGMWAMYANFGRIWVLWGSFLLGAVFLMVAAYRTWLNEHRQRVGETERSAKAIQELNQELARKHPYDEQAEAAVKKAIAKLDNNEVRFLGWLLTMDRPRRGQIQAQGFGTAPESILEKTSKLLIGYEPVCPGNGTVELDRIYHISPKSEQAIKDVLYPPLLVP